MKKQESPGFSRGEQVNFTWTRDGERITSTRPRCHATEKSRFPADIRRWQRSHTALACWRGRNRPVEARFTQPTRSER